MTGPEHYREAERLLDEARGQGYGGAQARIAAAQVHAQLANAAATMSVTFGILGASAQSLTPAVEAWADTLVPTR